MCVCVYTGRFNAYSSPQIRPWAGALFPMYVYVYIYLYVHVHLNMCACTYMHRVAERVHTRRPYPWAEAVPSTKRRRLGACAQDPPR